jgi:hypothetical protein
MRSLRHAEKRRMGFPLQTTRANLLLIYREDWLLISHVLSSPTLTSNWDESNDGEALASAYIISALQNHVKRAVKAAWHTGQNAFPLKSVSGKELEKCMTQVASGQ